MNNHSFRIGAIACVEAPGVQSIVRCAESMLRLDVPEWNVSGYGRSLEIAKLGSLVGDGFINESNAVGPTQRFYFRCCIASQAGKRGTQNDGQRNMTSH
ncbi:hypothetical protein [Stenotrophomonas sp. C1657]|uniref:hypothetical protein n=1 Tax=Stenotrophomonas sp. C1657 TaxID=3077844 RepID=UPI00293C13D0|nr:hypothetical protein [Stenotrophomonas sp. C1657]MDV3516585.1 hypothetical protein [Stenotrophomonas sp. C1657]